MNKVIRPYYREIMSLIRQRKFQEAENKLLSFPKNIYDHMCKYANQEKRFDRMFEYLEKVHKDESKYFLSKRKELEVSQGTRYQFETPLSLKISNLLYDDSNQEAFL